MLESLHLDWSVFAIVLGGALVTWMTRIGGPWLIARVRLGRAGSAALEATPGAVLVALVAPAALSRPSDALAAAFVCLIARRVPMVVAVVAGVVAVVLLRRLLQPPSVATLANCRLVKRAGDAYKSGMTDPISAPAASAANPAGFDPHALPPLRDVIARFGLEARKSLGQNFLLDLNLTGRIARSANLPAGTTAIEVGPGPGGLTRALLATNAVKVIAIERDRRFIEALQDVIEASQGRLSIVEADALTVDPEELAPAPRAIVANLPYNVATPLLLGWLARIEAYVSLTLMFQKEVADRLVAKPGSKAYGRLSVITQWRSDARVLFNLPPRAFTPPPKVESTVVHLTPRMNPEPADWRALEQVTAAAFGQRRKMLRQSLKSLGNAEALLEETGIAPTARAEEIDVAGFAALARAFRARHPLEPPSEAST